MHLDGDKAKQITSSLPFTNVGMMNTIGFVRRIQLLWNEAEVKVKVINRFEQKIHAIVKVSSNSLDWLLSGIYASQKLVNRKNIWKNLKSLAKVNSLPQIALGDFNEVLCQFEKLGGRLLDFHGIISFRIPSTYVSLQSDVVIINNIRAARPIDLDCHGQSIGPIADRPTNAQWCQHTRHSPS